MTTTGAMLAHLVDGPLRHTLPLRPHSHAIVTADLNVSLPTSLGFVNVTSGAWARLTLDKVRGEASGLYFSGEELLMLRGLSTETGDVQLLLSVRPFDELPRSAAWHSVEKLVSGARRRRRLQGYLPQGPAPFGRLPGCAPADELRVLSLGVVLDFGYVYAAGGRTAAVSELSASLHALNGLFEDQLGLRVEAKHVVVATSADAPFASVGHNAGPGPRPRPADAGVTLTLPVAWGGSLRSVVLSSPSYALGRFASWIGAHAPSGAEGAGLWHLLTDAFPPPGVTGLASLGVTCMVSTFCVTLLVDP